LEEKRREAITQSRRNPSGETGRNLGRGGNKAYRSTAPPRRIAPVGEARRAPVLGCLLPGRARAACSRCSGAPAGVRLRTQLPVVAGRGRGRGGRGGEEDCGLVWYQGVTPWWLGGRRGLLRLLAALESFLAVTMTLGTEAGHSGQVRWHVMCVCLFC
jgi:hypothetical protein